MEYELEQIDPNRPDTVMVTLSFDTLQQEPISDFLLDFPDFVQQQRVRMTEDSTQTTSFER